MVLNSKVLKVLIASNLLFIVQAAECNGSKEKEAELKHASDKIQTTLDAFFRQPTGNSSSSFAEPSKITPIIKKLVKSTIELSREETQFLDSLAQIDGQVAENRNKLELCTEEARTILKRWIKPELHNKVEKLINWLKEQQSPILNIPPKAAVPILLQKLSSQTIKKEKIDSVNSLVENYGSAKGIQTTKEFLLQLPILIIESLTKGLNKVEEIKQLFAHKTEATIKQLPKKLDELLVLHKECTDFQNFAKLLSSDSSDSSLHPSKIKTTINELKALHKKIEVDNNNVDKLHDVLSALNKIYKNFEEENKQSLSESHIENYFLALEIIYTYHYGCILVEETVKKIKSHASA